MSGRASEQLQGRRVLRLLEIELDEGTPLGRRSNGPLGGEVIRVWIDAPSPNSVLIEVRRTDRPVTRRKISISRFEPDIAARVVAIAASEMIHTQARPPRPKRLPETPPGPTEEGRDAAFRTAYGATSAMTALWMPTASPNLVLGPELALTHRRGPTGQQLYARWLVNGYDEHRLRWFEVGAAVDLRLPLPEPTWRVRVGAKAGAVALGIPQAAALGGTPAEPYDWSARAGGTIGIAARLPDAGWLELALEPGALLRSTTVTDRHGDSWSIGGFSLAGSLAWNVEVPRSPTRNVTTEPQRQK